MPDDFVAFVAGEKDDLRAQCDALTGHDELAEVLRLDLLAAVALRWRWWRLRGAPARGQAAQALLHRTLRREERTWPAERNRPGQREEPNRNRPARSSWRKPLRTRRSGTSDTEAGRMRVVAAEPTTERVDRPAAELAASAWSRARRVRHTRTATATVALVSVTILALLSPRLVRDVPPPVVGPTEVPAGVLLMPAYDKLSGLDIRGIVLPSNLDIGSDDVPLAPTPLRTKPPARVLALLKHADGPIYAFGPDGTVRVIDTPELTTARTQLYSTALSPDGLRAVFPSDHGILVLDLTTGSVHEVPTGGPPAAFVWRGDRTVIAPNFSTALQINVDTGAVGAIATTNGVDVLTQQGEKPTNPMLELLPANASPRLRLWRAEPVITTDPVRSSPPVSDVEDRPIFGPPWIGRWFGPGFADADLIVRACGAETIQLPRKSGTARSAIGALATNGLYIATLVGTDTTTLDVLGMVDSQTVLINATGPTSSTLLAWSPNLTLLQRVSTVSRTVVVSIADATAVLAK